MAFGQGRYSLHAGIIWKMFSFSGNRDSSKTNNLNSTSNFLCLFSRHSFTNLSSSFSHFADVFKEVPRSKFTLILSVCVILQGVSPCWKKVFASKQRGQIVNFFVKCQLPRLFFLAVLPYFCFSRCFVCQINT